MCACGVCVCACGVCVCVYGRPCVCACVCVCVFVLYLVNASICGEVASAENVNVLTTQLLLFLITCYVKITMFSLNSLIFIIIIINILCFNLNLKSQPECTLFMSYASDISNTTKHNTCVSIHPNVPPLGSVASLHGVAELLTER